MLSFNYQKGREIQVNSKKTPNNPTKKQAKDPNKHFSKKTYKWPT